MDSCPVACRLFDREPMSVNGTWQHPALSELLRDPRSVLFILHGDNRHSEFLRLCGKVAILYTHQKQGIQANHHQAIRGTHGLHTALP